MIDQVHVGFVGGLIKAAEEESKLPPNAWAVSPQEPPYASYLLPGELQPLSAKNRLKMIAPAAIGSAIGATGAWGLIHAIDKYYPNRLHLGTAARIGLPVLAGTIAPAVTLYKRRVLREEEDKLYAKQLEEEARRRAEKGRRPA